MTLRPTLRLPFLGFLLCLSGACALVYQTAWLRDLRLVFGGATPAAAAVLAIFMGGLGAGSALLGRRSETVHDPLRLYGLIEIGVGASALLTPFLLAAVRALYVRTGGITALGLGPATLLQLGLSAVVLAAPCVLMGGSLPAAFKWAEAVRAERDAQRGDLGVLYGLNTLGAVAGVMASTFWLLEAWGIRATVWAAAAVNLAVGAAAVWVARGRGNDPDPRRQARPVSGGAQAAGASHRTGRPSAGPLAPDAVGQRVAPRFVFLAAAITGFAFFLMELVWFRMLAPLVGSSLYGFGLILAVALAGIGAGGLLYRWWWAPYPGAVSPRSLARVSAWQALLLAVPWALGDSIAVFAYHVNGLRALGLAGQITGWALVTGLLVLGPSLLAGVQFPLLVGLLGEGARDAGRDVGHAYAANTLGAVAGALAGGFILVPGLAATGSWRLVVGLTLGLSLGAAVLAIRAASRLDLAATAGLWVCAAFLVLALPGPTAAWRHVPIGYGRIGALPTTVNGLREWQTERRSDVLREIEGREASVAVAIGGSGHALLVGGKSDGTAFGDADTQVMLGLLPAMLHPEPRTAFVVGLGTGTTAGWLADVPGMQRVDVAEIEPGIAALAREFFAPVNRGALDKPNVRLIAGDARELLVTRGPVYDLIVSEPSNPYRAGVATLYTEEYYAAVKGRLAPGGLFGQWLQGYEVDSRAVRLVYATLASVFPFVETWVTEMGDLLFICHLAPPAYPMDQLRTRIAQPPYAEAIRRVWLTDSVEGVLARHLATPDVARRIAAINGERNTDDRNRLEYGFARALSQASAFDAGQVLSMALAANADVPAHLVGQVDARRIQLERLLMLAADDTGFVVPPSSWATIGAAPRPCWRSSIGATPTSCACGPASRMDRWRRSCCLSRRPERRRRKMCGRGSVRSSMTGQRMPGSRPPRPRRATGRPTRPWSTSSRGSPPCGGRCGPGRRRPRAPSRWRCGWRRGSPTMRGRFWSRCASRSRAGWRSPLAEMPWRPSDRISRLSSSSRWPRASIRIRRGTAPSWSSAGMPCPGPATRGRTPRRAMSRPSFGMLIRHCRRRAPPARDRLRRTARPRRLTLT